MLEQKTTHIAELVGNLVEQFKAQPKLVGFLTAFARQIQEAENAAFEVLADSAIDSAVGVQLDGIGDIVGLPRDGLADPEYRTEIKAKILVNLSSGTIEQMIAVAAAMVGTTKTIRLTEYTGSDPALIELEIVETIAEDGARIARLLESAKPAGVRLIFRWASTATPFAFDTTDQGFDKGELTGAI